MFVCHAYLYAMFYCCLGWCNMLGDAMIRCMLWFVMWWYAWLDEYKVDMRCHARWMLGWYDMYVWVGICHARWMLGFGWCHARWMIRSFWDDWYYVDC